MCWHTECSPIKRIAEKDIKVCKIFLIEQNVIKSPIYRNTIWDRRKTYTTELEDPVFNILDSSNIYKGFHSLLHRPHIRKIDAFCCTTDVWATKGKSKALFEKRDYQEVLECIIPKGSEYYINEYEEIVSNKLMIPQYETNNI